MSPTLIAAALAIRLVASHGYPEGAPPGFSGGFGEQACDACHFEATINTGPGKVLLAGVPDRFTPGERYTLTLTLTRPGMRLGGFQLTARFEDGGAQAGGLAPGPAHAEHLTVESQNGIQYVGQHASGTGLAAPDTASWTLIWTAPPSGGPVVFHVAANAADGDGTAEGDYVHTTTAVSSPDGAASGRTGPYRPARLGAIYAPAPANRPCSSRTAAPSSSRGQSSGSTSAIGIVTP
ncbi:MAG: choice-of-anchor V domain-containing protein [Vicinamibacterales bacterium]